MKKIKDIVTINSQAVLDNAIQLSWYHDEEKQTDNNNLVSGYVFGNSVHKWVNNHWESSSLPIFQQIWKTFDNRQSSNIFTVVAHYGHGKSHFALVLANYFGLAPDSPVVTNIIDHLQICSDKPTADQFRYFKDQTTRPQLVVTLAGTDFQDLRQGFLQALRRALNVNEATRSYPIKSISAKAAEWLKGLTSEEIEKADDFLSEKYETDVDSLIVALDSFESGKETIVKDLSRIFNNGFALNFGEDVNLKEVVKDIADTLCTGAGAPFHKMLILFDELGVYAGKWCHHSTASGGFALQEILEACLEYRGKICFVGFVQRDLSEFVKNYSPEIQSEFEKLAGRMHKDAVYHLVSNLEEVISKLLKKESDWKQTIADFSIPLRKESIISRETITRYFENWDETEFYQIVANNCFPLHPMTTGLLCSFDFTQGSRTIIGAVDSMLKMIQEKAVSENGMLNFIRPIELVREFEQDFIKNKSRVFADYQEILATALTTDAEPILIDILKALFLFKEAKMTKRNRYEHAELLAPLAGYTLAQTKDALEKLQSDFEAVRFSPQKREYEFSDSVSSRKIVLEMANKAIVGKQTDSLVRLLEKLKAFDDFKPHDSIAREFKADFAIEGDEWFLAPRYIDASRLSIKEIKENLCKKTIEEGGARGTVIYVISGSSAELDTARNEADSIFQKLKEENYTHPFVIAIPTEASSDLEKQALIKNFIDYEISNPDKIRFVESHRAAREFTNKELNDLLVAHLRTVKYFIPEELKLKFGNKDKPLDEIADALFAGSYKFRAPSKSDKMRPTSRVVNTLTASIARQLIMNNLSFESLDTDIKNVIRQVLIEGSNKWGILDEKYKIREPENIRVKEGWRFLTENVSKLKPTSFKKLISALRLPPYGYDDFTATLLITAWIGKHKHELAFKDESHPQPIRYSNSQQNGFQANLSLGGLQNNLNRAKDFIKFLESKVWVQNSGDLVRENAKEYLEKLKTVTDFEESKKLLELREQITQPLTDGDELISQINEEWENKKTAVDGSITIIKELEKIRRDTESNNKISELLKTINLLNVFGNQNRIQSSSEFVSTLKFVEEKISSVAQKDSSVILLRIESYDGIQDNLEKSRDELNLAGRTDLAKLYIDAIERIEKDYSRLQTELSEKPLLNEINSFQTKGMPLDYSIKALKRLEEILTNYQSANIIGAAEEKQRQFIDYITNLREFAENLPSHIKAINDVAKAEDLRSKIYQKQSKYENTPEAVLISDSLNILTTHIDELKAERRRQIEVENELKRQELASLTAQKISEEFKKITDEDLRFKILVEILESTKTLDLSPNQKEKLKVLLD